MVDIKIKASTSPRYPIAAVVAKGGERRAVPVPALTRDPRPWRESAGLDSCPEGGLKVAETLYLGGFRLSLGGAAPVPALGVSGLGEEAQAIAPEREVRLGHRQQPHLRCATEFILDSRRFWYSTKVPLNKK